MLLTGGPLLRFLAVSEWCVVVICVVVAVGQMLDTACFFSRLFVVSPATMLLFL